MGTDITHSCCSVCGNKAIEIDDYCQHIGAFGVNKGSEWDHPETGLKTVSYESCYGLSFFEDSMIMPEQWNGEPDSQGADVSAKFLQILAAKDTATIEQKKLAGQMRMIYSRLPDDKKVAFIKLLSSIE